MVDYSTGYWLAVASFLDDGVDLPTATHQLVIGAVFDTGRDAFAVGATVEVEAGQQPFSLEDHGFSGVGVSWVAASPRSRRSSSRFVAR